MIALVARVNIIRSRVFDTSPIMNELDIKHYLIRIPETGPNRHAVKPSMSDEEAVNHLLKKLKSIHGTKRVILSKVYRTDDPDLLNAPIQP